VTSLAAATLGAALTAAIVARRRAERLTEAVPPAAGGPAAEPPTEAAPEAPDPTATPPAPDPTGDPPVPDPTATPPVPDPTGDPPVPDPTATPPVPDPTATPAVPDADAGTPRVDGPGRTRPVAVGLALVVALAAGVGLFAAVGDDDRSDADVEAGVTTSVEPTTTTAIDALSPQEAFAQAADRLAAAGSFGYVGTTSAIDVSHVRPGLWLAVDLTVEGEVLTSAESVHEIAIDDTGRAAETVSDGAVVWGRLATSREALREAPYVPITEESGAQAAGKGVALLPPWLDSTVDRQDAGTDGRGNRLLRATLPASVLGEIVDGRPAADASVLLAIDAAGDPVRVEIASLPAGPPLRLALDLVRIGEPVVIDLPVDAP
jgi:hypothetical protein